LNVVTISGPVILGSAPGAAAFFVTYETSKKTLQKYSTSKRKKLDRNISRYALNDAHPYNERIGAVFHVGLV
jgi:hypothetical protein